MELPELPRVQHTTSVAMSDLNEARTRALLINPQLEKVGWNLSDHSQVQFEVTVKGYDPNSVERLYRFLFVSPRRDHSCGH